MCVISRVAMTWCSRRVFRRRRRGVVVCDVSYDGPSRPRSSVMLATTATRIAGTTIAKAETMATQANLTQQILSMRSKSADILVIFATPSPTIRDISVIETAPGGVRLTVVARQPDADQPRLRNVRRQRQHLRRERDRLAIHDGVARVDRGAGHAVPGAVRSRR